MLVNAHHEMYFKWLTMYVYAPLTIHWFQTNTQMPYTHLLVCGHELVKGEACDIAVLQHGRNLVTHNLA